MRLRGLSVNESLPGAGLREPQASAHLLVNSIHLHPTRIAGQIWGDAKLLGAPVAEAFEERNQGLAGGAERVGDLRRRGSRCSSVGDAILFQFTNLRDENLFAEA